ncbi:MAG TPA: anti-sigma factor [Gaiellaceae bacterium]|nr:anti-sigma factor [Gaiellaceae bacterium]
MENGAVQGTMELVLRPWVATCAETRERLSAHLDGELAGRDGKRVLRHLALCRHCRELLRSLARAVEGVRTLGQSDAPSPGPSVADAVVDRIRHQGD